MEKYGITICVNKGWSMRACLLEGYRQIANNGYSYATVKMPNEAFFVLEKVERGRYKIKYFSQNYYCIAESPIMSGKTFRRLFKCVHPDFTHNAVKQFYHFGRKVREDIYKQNRLLDSIQKVVNTKKQI